MRRTALSITGLACAAVLAGAVPAFADGTPTTQPTPTASVPASAEPTEAPSATPTREPSTVPSGEPTAVPSAVPTRDSGRGQVSAVPQGAPDTGVTGASSGSGSYAGPIGGGLAALLVAGGGAVFVVRRRRATGA